MRGNFPGRVPEESVRNNMKESGSREPPTRAERQSARIAKREQERQQSTLRAKEMRSARLVWESTHDRVSVPGPPALPAPLIHVGCSGWFYWHWRGVFYPDSLPTRSWFEHYLRRFDTVELNAPFYSWPTRATVQGWIRQAGRRKFVYTIKVSELITHVKRFTGTKRMVGDFGHIADLLGSRMGCFLFQLPPSFHYTPARLRGILTQLDPARRNVLEFRHSSWWDDRVFSTIQERGAIFCSCSAPRLPSDLIATDGEVYLRFHGLSRWYRHDYTQEELETWVDRIRASRARRVWAYFNNDRDGHALRNARTFRRMLRNAL